MTWETIIGLEVHVQLGTKAKMFCGCAVRFGQPPNTDVCPVCLGLPGALPSTNEAAIRLGVVGALALGCEIHPVSVFARKSYFYPDLPKGYQVSQFDRPLATGGSIDVATPDRGVVRVGITRLHLEEDAGKSLHDRIAGHTAIDLNRAGTPLAEIVGHHDLRSPAEARAYLVTLRQLLVYAGVSECSMEQGSLRVDANLSVHRPGTPLGVKTEVKNMNSFANVERALEAEHRRQVALLESGGKVRQVTLTFDAASGSVRVLRDKEDADDYRYFSDPDLPQLVLDEDWIARCRSELPESPGARRERFAIQHGLPDYDIGVLTAEPQVADYLEAVVAAGSPAKSAANWIMGESMSGFNETGKFGVDADRLARLIAMVESGNVSLQAAKRIHIELLVADDDPAEVAQRLGLVQVSDGAALATWVEAVIAEFPDETRRLREGEGKLVGFFVGQVMKRSGGKADPKAVQPILRDRIGY